MPKLHFTSTISISSKTNDYTAQKIALSLNTKMNSKISNTG